MSFLYRYLLSERESLLLIGTLVDWLTNNENEEVQKIFEELYDEFNQQFRKVNKLPVKSGMALTEAINEIIQKHAEKTA